MRIAEIFHSIQGEGKLAGLPSVFIRTSGCNLRCTWCDSPYTSWEPEGQELSIDEIMQRVGGFGCKHVVLTGGEPMIARSVETLTHRIKQDGYHLTIETAATVWKEVACDLASISPKLSNSTPHDREDGKWVKSHEAARLNVDVIRRFLTFASFQLKFVIEEPGDLTEIDALLSKLGPIEPANVLLMPQGVTHEEINQRAPAIVDLCKQRGYRYCPRLHLELFGNARGT